MAVRLAFKSFGEGPPLVVLHGLLGSGTNWQSLARRLGEGYRVLVVDQRNHGVSPHTETMDYPAMAEDLHALLDDQGLAEVSLLGHSMGGKTAMFAALAAPERIARLLVVDIAPVRYRRDYSDLLAALRAVNLEAVSRRAEAEAQLAERIHHHSLRLFLLQNLVHGPHGWRWRIHLDGIEAGMPALFDFPEPAPGARYDGPTLFVRGEHSDYVLDAHGERIEALFPRAQIRTVPGTGHWLHAEAPREFLAAIADFLALPAA